VTLRAAVQFAAVAIGLVASVLVLSLAGHSPGDSLSALFRGAFGSQFALEQSTLKAIPLALTGLAVALPLRMRLWNIGAEGQLYAGAIGATWAVLEFGDASQPLLLAAMSASAAVAGAVWALLAAIPRALWGVNEIITTLLLNYVAIQLLAYLVTGPWRGKESFGFPLTDPFPETAALPKIGASTIHVGVFFPVAAAIVLVLLLRTTRWGFEVRMIGASPDAARVAGMSTARNIVTVMAVAGATAGLAGMIEVGNTFGALQQGISPGYGYMAIVIAALAGANLLATLVVALLFGGFVIGGLALQTRNVPQAFVLLLQGLILFAALAGARLARIRLRRRARAPTLLDQEAPSTL
jgi:simple sugar transport system permease protein